MLPVTHVAASREVKLGDKANGYSCTYVCDVYIYCVHRILCNVRT